MLEESDNNLYTFSSLIKANKYNNFYNCVLHNFDILKQMKSVLVILIFLRSTTPS